MLSLFRIKCLLESRGTVRGEGRIIRSMVLEIPEGVMRRLIKQLPEGKGECLYHFLWDTSLAQHVITFIYLPEL